MNEENPRTRGWKFKGYILDPGCVRARREVDSDESRSRCSTPTLIRGGGAGGVDIVEGGIGAVLIKIELKSMGECPAYSRVNTCGDCRQ